MRSDAREVSDTIFIRRMGRTAVLLSSALLFLILSEVVAVSQLPVDPGLFGLESTQSAVWALMRLVALSVVSVAILIGAIGLLRQREWGRRLLLSSIWVAAVGLAGVAVGQIARRGSITSPDQSPDFTKTIGWIRVSGVALPAIGVILAKGIRRLRSKSVRAQFC